MLALLFSVWASITLASPPICEFGNENYFFTTESVDFSSYDSVCQGLGAQSVVFHQPEGEEHLIPWLRTRRGMRSCLTFKAFVRCAIPSKAGQDLTDEECCVVTPKGIQRHEQCPPDLSLPGLCQLVP